MRPSRVRARSRGNWFLALKAGRQSQLGFLLLAHFHGEIRSLQSQAIPDLIGALFEILQSAIVSDDVVALGDLL